MPASGPDIECRRAAAADWERIWPVFQAVVEPGDTYAFPPDIGEEEARSLWLLEGAERAATYVAEQDGEVVATAYLKPNQIGPGDHVANAGWMVSPASTGKGVGRRLAEHVIEEARHLGFTGMQFNAVVATNTAAIRLWESLGFTIVGSVPDAFRHPKEGLTPVHIMYRRLVPRPSVLFLCVKNAGRSQMAAGWLRHLAGDRVAVFSGGSDPGPELHPQAVEAMTEVGIDISGEQPKRWSEAEVSAADVVVTMGCGDACPFYPGTRYEDWELTDPAEQPIEVVREVRDEIRRRVEALITSLEPSSAP